MRRLFLAAALLAAMLIPSSSALATVHSPTGEFAPFKYCPVDNPSLTHCLVSKTTSGFLTIGKKTTPVVNPQILQGGLIITPSSETIKTTFVAAETGQTLVKTPQPVPGGLLGVQAPSWWPSVLRNLFNETINNGFTGVTATMELAAPASSIKLDMINMLEQRGTALELPVKVKLGNAFLGNNCYIGSNSNPITLKLTTGTTSPPPPNTPISGKNASSVSGNPAGTLTVLSGNRLVDNSFSVPGANGCGGFLFSWAVDPFVDSIVGIPSPAGKNTAVLEGEVQLAQVGAVRASE